MTREEAIKVLNMVEAYGLADEAKKVAIEALQTKGVGRYENAMQKLREMPRYLNGVKEKRKAEPVKHGTWTITDTDDGEGGEIPHFICSECNSEPMAWSSRRLFNYCPNCGAKMDKD